MFYTSTASAASDKYDVCCARCVQDVCKVCSICVQVCARCVQGVLNMCARCMHMPCLISLLEPHAFRKYSTCWVLEKSVHACVVNVIRAKVLPGSVLNIEH